MHFDLGTNKNQTISTVSAFCVLYIPACRSSISNLDVPEGGWQMLLPAQKLSAHKIHTFSGSQLKPVNIVTHVRVFMAPDGGISRMRLWGKIQNFSEL